MTINNYNDLFCTFIKIDNKYYECMKCKNSIIIQDDLDEPPLIPCSSPLVDFDPTRIQSQITEDKNNLCSIEEIERRHNVCLSCDFFKDNLCEKCGCFLSRDRIYLNKLATADQSCPINKW